MGIVTRKAKLRIHRYLLQWRAPTKMVRFLWWRHKAERTKLLPPKLQILPRTWMRKRISNWYQMIVAHHILQLSTVFFGGQKTINNQIASMQKLGTCCFILYGDSSLPRNRSLPLAWILRVKEFENGANPIFFLFKKKKWNWEIGKPHSKDLVMIKFESFWFDCAFPIQVLSIWIPQ